MEAEQGVRGTQGRRGDGERGAAPGRPPEGRGARGELREPTQGEERRRGRPEQVAEVRAEQEVPADLVGIQGEEVLCPLGLDQVQARRRGRRGGRKVHENFELPLPLQEETMNLRNGSQRFSESRQTAGVEPRGAIPS